MEQRCAHLPVQGAAGHHLLSVPGWQVGAAGQQEAPRTPRHGGAAGDCQEGEQKNSITVDINIVIM